MSRILILESDAYIRAFAVGALRRAGFDTVEAATQQEAVDQLAGLDELSGAVLSLSTPDADVFAICEQIRLQQSDAAILVLATDAEQTDAVTGLMTGADECLKKPFAPSELVGRLRSLLENERDAGAVADQLLSSGPFLLDTRAYSLEKLGQTIALTRAEYSMVKFFLENPDKALSRQEIFDYVWGKDEYADLKMVEQKIRHLRLKLEDDPQKPVYITTVWGYGYQWNS